MRYFVCAIGNFEEYSDRYNILRECLSNNLYELHSDARWPAPFSQIQKGDTLLLKFQNQIVAWGLAKGNVRHEAHDFNQGWNRIVDVDCWYPFDPQSPPTGVHHYGILSATKSGGPYATVKEVDEVWAQEKLEFFPNFTLISNTASMPYSDKNQVRCEQKSLKELFQLPLRIPDYQRCYCWRKGNVTDLLETLRSRRRAPDTHLGTVILKEEQQGGFSVVDGQQRLLTLTILGFRLKKKGWPLPLLDAPLRETASATESAQKHLSWANVSTQEWTVANRLDDESIENLLNQIRFTVITLPEKYSEDLAYRFFNAVNSAGKKLSDYDLLKAHHLRFISEEPLAKSMAERWDATGEEGYDDVLHKTLYRLRVWSRFETPGMDAREDHQLFRHFSAVDSGSIQGLFFSPLAMQFNSAIRGGAPFFHFADQHRLLWLDFQRAEAYTLLSNHLARHSRNILRDCIGSLLFIFYCRFGRAYLDDALFCIADTVSALRNDSRISAYTLRAPVLKECLFSLGTSLDPGQFFDWCLLPERQYAPDTAGGAKKRYWEALQALYSNLEKRLLVLNEQCAFRSELLPVNTDL